MPGRLADETAIVTGAAQGIGYAIAERFAEEGARIVVADVQADAAEEAARTLGGIEACPDTLAVECDVTSREDTRRLAARVVEVFDGVNVLVNNAGISVHGEFLDLDPEDWDRVIDVNLTGVYNCSAAVVPEMLDGDEAGGAVVNVSSMAGRGISYHAAANYTASKWGVIGLTKHMAWDLGEHGVRVTAVCPGSTLTPLTEGATEPEERAATSRKIPLDRWADPGDIADGALYLASEEADYVTGTVLEIDGGKQLGVRNEI
ncbi:SDR family NAD(P)-dependent oxidoreductase [Salinirubellus sp. GCM10025818]|uniref:SDR family NAD(P)-dependent oxidoreductase n=1 Tax=Salinirubellus TaxID=2162630 RepID=UPI0030D05355